MGNYLSFPTAEEACFKLKKHKNIQTFDDILFVPDYWLFFDEHSMIYAKSAINKAIKKGYYRVEYLTAFEMSQGNISKLEKLGYKITITYDTIFVDWYDTYIEISWLPNN
jgi:hypothetical protein